MEDTGCAGIVVIFLLACAATVLAGFLLHIGWTFYH